MVKLKAKGLVANLDDGNEKDQEKCLHASLAPINSSVLGGTWLFVSLIMKALLQQKDTD